MRACVAVRSEQPRPTRREIKQKRPLCFHINDAYFLSIRTPPSLRSLAGALLHVALRCVVLRCVALCSVVWFSVVSCCVLLCGVVRCGMVWCGVVWCSVALRCVALRCVVLEWRSHVDEELCPEGDEVGVVHGGRDGHAAGAPAVHEAQAAKEKISKPRRGGRGERVWRGHGQGGAKRGDRKPSHTLKPPGERDKQRSTAPNDKPSRACARANARGTTVLCDMFTRKGSTTTHDTPPRVLTRTVFTAAQDFHKPRSKSTRNRAGNRLLSTWGAEQNRSHNDTEKGYNRGRRRCRPNTVIIAARDYTGRTRT